MTEVECVRALVRCQAECDRLHVLMLEKEVEHEAAKRAYVEMLRNRESLMKELETAVSLAAVAITRR